MTIKSSSNLQLRMKDGEVIELEFLTTLSRQWVDKIASMS